MRAQRVNNVANFNPIFVKLGAISANGTVGPFAVGVKGDVYGVFVVQTTPLRAVGVNGHRVGNHPNKRTKIHPKIHTLLDRPIVEREQSQHIKVQIVGAVANFIQVVQTQTMLNIRNRFRNGGRQEGGFVFLHPRSGEQGRRIGGKNTVVDSERQTTQQTKLLVHFHYIAWRGDIASS